MSFAASSCSKIRRASATVTRFFVRRFGKNAAEHLADVAALIDAAADHADRQAWRLFDLDLDQAHVVEAALDLAARLVAHALRVGGGRRRRCGVRLLLTGEVVAEDRAQRRAERIALRLRDGGRVSGCSASITRSTAWRCGEIANLVAPLVGDRANRRFDEIAHHRLDVAPDVADLGVLRRLDLHERRADERREAARDLGLADAGRADHQNVLRRDLVAQVLARPRAPVAVAQRDGDGAFRLRLTRRCTCRAPRRSGGASAAPDRGSVGGTPITGASPR